MEDSRKNVIGKGISNVALKARKGYTKFMYKDSTARSEYLGVIDEKIANNNATLEENKALKEAKRDEKLKLKAKKLAEREERENEFNFGFKKRDFENDEESESKPRRSLFSKITGLYNDDEEVEDQELEFIDVTQFRDAQFKPFGEKDKKNSSDEKKFPLSGRDLLGRDYNCTPLYIESKGDMLKVTSASIIESDHVGCVTLLLTTAREDFLVDFEYKF